MDHGAGHAEAATPTVAPVDVYLAAYQWGFDPDVLRLDAGRPYRFRMMALDASHGASIHLGPGSRINRLRPGQLAEQVMTFTEPGEYLVYCTIYCGIGHDRMFGKIVVS
jgi:heme/copper-type cytochrome/quinol oxidase subunit 2